MRMVQHTVIMMIMMLSPIFGLAAGGSDEAEKRADAIRLALENIKDVDVQLNQLDKDLSKLQAAGDDIASRSELIVNQGKALTARFGKLKKRDDQYGEDVDDHDARCPRESPDAALVARCNKEKDELDSRSQAIQSDTNQWTADKDSLVKGVENLAKEAAQNQRQLEHNAFSTRVLEQAKARLLQELGQLEKEVSTCAEHLRGEVSCERIKHECGNVEFDGANKDLKDSQGTPCNP